MKRIACVKRRASVTTLLVLLLINLGSTAVAAERPNVEGDDLWRTQAPPVPRCGTWHSTSNGELDVTGLVDDIAETMVVAATDSLGFHTPRIRPACAMTTASLPEQW